MKKQLRLKLTKSLLAVIAIVSILPIVQPVFALPEPTVSTDPATNITTTTATLNGTVSDAGDSPVTSRGFNYGTTDSYGSIANEVIPESYEYVSQWGSAATNDGKLSAPDSVVIDSAGNRYVSDTDNHRIQKFNSSGVYQSQFGGPTFGSGDGEFISPKGMAIDSGGNLYVADSGNHRIQKFNSSGVYQSQFGGSGTGDGQLNRPDSVVIDSTGNIYVADTNNHRIQKFNSSGVYQSQFGSYGFGDGQFYAPRGISFDSSNNIYIVDSNNSRVQKFNSSGVYLSQFGGIGSGDGQFNTPYGITIDASNNLYVADTNNHRIQKFNSSGVYQSQFGSIGSGDGQLFQPSGITLDTDGSFMIADTGNNRIQKFNSSAVYQSKFGMNCSGNSQFNFIQGVAIDPVGDVYVSDADDKCVQKFNSTGFYQSQFGSFGTQNGQLNFPGKINIDPSGNIFVADTVNSRVQKFNSSGVYQSQFGGGGAGNGQFTNPRDLAFDSFGNIYVVDSSNHRIQKFNSSGVYQSQFGSLGSGDGQFNGPVAIAVDSFDNIYVADTNNHRIQKFNSSGVYQSKFGSYGSSNGQFAGPNDLTFDSLGNIFVLDTYNNRVQKFNSSGVYLLQFGSVGSGNGEFSLPRAIAIDSNDTIYIGDTLNERVQTFTQGMNEGAFSTNLTNLTCGTTYHYQAYANNSHGSTQAIDATFSTEACEPGPPTNLSATASSPSSINITWDEPQEAGDSAISYYIVSLRKDGDIDWVSALTPDNNTTFTWIGLEPDTQYEIKVKTRNTNDYISIYSNIVTATTDIYVNPTPDPPTNLQATIGSSSTINVTWNAPVNTGDSPISKYYIYYQKVGDGSWGSLDPDNDNTSATISGLQPSTQYNIKVIARNSNNNDSIDSEIITATTATPDFYLITDCQQLQDIQNDLVGNYELARDIDCSDSINWNGGKGFIPIGSPLTASPFSGIIAGNNYTIEDLYINQDGEEYAFAALFGGTDGALIQDLRVVRPVISALNSSFSIPATLTAYDASTSSKTTTFNNVHIVDAHLEGGGELITVAGGMVGLTQNSGTAADNLNEFQGTIELHGSMGQLVVAGGLYGQMDGGIRSVNNSYAVADITIENTFSGSGDSYSIAGGLLGGNGLIQREPTQSIFNHSYAAGSISHNGVDPNGGIALGGTTGLVTRDGSISNTFARNTLTNTQSDATEFVGGVVAGFYGSGDRSFTNNYFDADQAGTTDCIDPVFGSISGCTPIQGQPNYFYNNTTNAPLNTWDFDNIWKTTSTLPVFGEKVLTSITAIPESRLNPDPVTPPAGGVPAIAELTKKLKAPTVLTQLAAQETTSAPKEDTGILGAIKRFFKNIPGSVLVSFPYILFALLLLAAGAMLVQFLIGSRRLKETKLLIAKQKAVAEERDTFWHLAANYLRAPITLMIGGVELLSTDKDIRLPAVAQLEVFAKNLQKKVFAIMSHIEQSRTLQDIHWPELESGGRVLTQLKFWLPVGLVAFFAVSMNLVAKNYRNLSVSTTNLAIQLLIFILVSVLFYWVLSALGLVNRKRKQAQALLEQQSATLDDARTYFIEQSAATLDKDLSDFEAQLDSIPKKAASVGIIHEGAHRLRTLIDSFELLVAAQNNKLDNLSPATAHTQLNTIFDGVLASLQPIISQKQLKVVTPNLNNVTLPGNALLLNQVIGSVVSNAVAFSPSGSTIQLDLKQHKDGTRLSVTNQGETIDEDQLSHVFSPLTKADGYDALQLDHGGLGVNLYIDRLIMQHLGGGISVASDASKGTTLTMLWPKNIT